MQMLTPKQLKGCTGYC